MKHVYLFYFFVTLCTGIVSLGITAFLYIETKERLIRSYLYFYSAFTLFVLIDMVFTYLRLNLHISPEMVHGLHYVVNVTVFVWIFTLLLFMHTLFPIRHAAARNLVGGVLLFIIAPGHYVVDYVIRDATVGHMFEYSEILLFLLVYGYILGLGIVTLRKLQEISERHLTQKILLLFGLGFPGFFVDTLLLEKVTNFRLFPLFYCGVSIMLTHHFLQYAAYPPQVRPFHGDPKGSSTGIDDTALFEQHAISPREQDIVRLIIQGYSNKQIAEHLSITVSTVKKHITSVYQKMDIKSRYELIARFKNIECS